jgi:hypothetical protein
VSGYVYILSNQSMPGIVKIGRSINGGASRAKNFYEGATGVPTPFALEFELFTKDPVWLESATHKHLKNRRVNNGREFFRCDVDQAISAVMKEFLSLIDQVVIQQDEYAAVEGADALARRIEGSDYGIYLNVCYAISFVEQSAIEKALKQREAFLLKARAKLNGSKRA